MKVGDLVKIRRAAIGVPVGTMGLIIASYDVSADYAIRGYSAAMGEKIHILRLLGARPGHNRRYLGRDLEVINESR
jgi:hypothetical protein